MGKFIAVVRFDSVTTFEEYSRIVMGLIGSGLHLEIRNDPSSKDVKPEWIGWQIIVTAADVSATT